MLRRLAVALTLVSVGLVAVPGAGWAHGGDETEEGYLLVQQALGHLAHDTSANGIDLAMEKVDDALATKDQEGVDVPEVEQAMSALQAGDTARARRLLQDSIKEAVDHLPQARGDDTGTRVVAPALPGRTEIGGQGWGFLAASVAALLAGLWLTRRFRPRDNVDQLQRLLGHAGTGEDAEQPEALVPGRAS